MEDDIVSHTVHGVSIASGISSAAQRAWLRMPRDRPRQDHTGEDGEEWRTSEESCCWNPEPHGRRGRRFRLFQNLQEQYRDHDGQQGCIGSFPIGNVSSGGSKPMMQARTPDTSPLQWFH